MDSAGSVVESLGVLRLPDGHGSNPQSFHSPGWVKTSSNPVPRGNGLYSTSVFSASAKTLASTLWSRRKRTLIWAIEAQKRLLKRRWRDLMSLLKPLLGCHTLMWQVVVEWIMLLFLRSLCKHLIVAVQVTVSMWECPQIHGCPVERFGHLCAIQRRLLLFNEYLNTFFW